METTKSYIWSFVNRFLHIILIVTFFGAFLLEDANVYLHSSLGIIFGVAVLMRIVWGVFGSRYSKLWDLKISGIFAYFVSILGEKKRYVGHNPASSLAIILMLILGVMLVISGFAEYAKEEHLGLFSGFSYSTIHTLKELHEFSANALLLAVCVHICGVLVDKFYNKGDCLESMISGYKKTQGDFSVRLNAAQKGLCAIYIVIFIALIAYLLEPNNILLGGVKNFAY
ncbi:MAG: cytochrome b/b6 domain-containing protein [Helicobacteraceae bacterium]|nr:cytochrome b/b6 domain-containing protein [Helicobacteraceae bacterium]